MSEPVEPLDDAEFAAVDHALGLLGEPARGVAERRMRRDPAFRAEVEAWQERLATLASAVEPVAPPASLWRRIEADLPMRAPAPDPMFAPVFRRMVPAFWRWLALGSGAVAAASLAALVFVAGPLQPVDGDGPEAALLAGTIAGDEGFPIFAMVLDEGGESLTLVPIRLDLSAGQVPELWLVHEGAAPRSLGLLEAERPLRVRLAPGAGSLAGGTLAVSIEPAGGSPTGQPTGPVVGHGQLSSI